MMSTNNAAKQFALKVFWLTQTQRHAIRQQIGELPSDVQDYLEELEQQFPVLHRLSEAQRKMIYTSLENSEWDIFKEHLMNFGQLNNQHPSKLHEIILAH